MYTSRSFHFFAPLGAVVLLVAASCRAQMAKGATKFLGNITTSGSVRSDFMNYWNQITAENECKWISVEGTRDKMNWGGCDNVYNYAKKNGIPFKFHTFVWGSQYPNWITSLSQADQLAEITEWMDEAQKRYPDAQIIDVVNEAMSNHAPAPFKDALGGAGTTGYDWIVASFKMARARWPNALLVYNDYNVLRTAPAEYINICKAIKAAGVLDGVGCQAHGLENQTVATLTSSIQKLHDQIGVPIYISEYDINNADDTKQKTIMSQQFPVFWESPYVAGVTIWGYVNGAVWQDNSGLMTSGGTERPALTWLKSYVKGKLNVTSPVDWSKIGTVNAAPVFVSSNSISVPENSTAVVACKATDSDNDVVTYSISGGEDSSQFAIDKTTGTLSFRAAPDFEKPADVGSDNTYRVNVDASDTKTMSIQSMTVRVTDVVEPVGVRSRSADLVRSRVIWLDVRGCVLRSETQWLDPKLPRPSKPSDIGGLHVARISMDGYGVRNVLSSDIMPR